ncbi:MAG: hypothetical protein Q8N90_02680 [bacterium]|nr:hypothetical protein [bacterium]
MKKLVFFLIFLVLTASLVFADTPAQKDNAAILKEIAKQVVPSKPAPVEHRANFAIKFRYTPIPYLLGSLRENWNTELYNIDPDDHSISRPYMVEMFSIFKDLAGANSPDNPYDAYIFAFHGDTKFPVERYDKVVLQGSSKTKTSGFPIDVGLELRVVKNLWLAVDVFYQKQHVTTLEEMYYLYFQRIVGPYYEDWDGQLISVYYCTTRITHMRTTTETNVKIFEIAPMLKYEIPLGKRFSLAPKAGIVWQSLKAQNMKTDAYFESTWPLLYYTNRAVWENPGSYSITAPDQAKSKVAAIVGLDLDLKLAKWLKIGLEAEYRPGREKISYIAHDSEYNYDYGMVWYTTIYSNIKLYADEFKKFEHSSAKGKIGKDDFLHYDKMNLLKLSIGFKLTF